MTNQYLQNNNHCNALDIYLSPLIHPLLLPYPEQEDGSITIFKSATPSYPAKSATKELRVGMVCTTYRIPHPRQRLISTLINIQTVCRRTPTPHARIVLLLAIIKRARRRARVDDAHCDRSRLRRRRADLARLACVEVSCVVHFVACPAVGLRA